MKNLTVEDVEATLLDSMLDLHEELLERRLECSDFQASVLLERYRDFQYEVLMLLHASPEGRPEGK